jgi:5-methylcytosine-specific restriction endonuclease McrA
MLKYLDGKSCELCGEVDIRTFEFDHVTPAEKNFSISQAVSLGHSWDDVDEEINKCRILCANCHKKQTAEQFGWYKV